MEQPERWDSQVQPEQLETPAYQDTVVYRGGPVNKDLQVTTVQEDSMVLLDIQEQLGSRAKQDLLDLPGVVDIRDLQDTLATKVQRVNEVTREKQDLRAREGLMVNRGLPATLDRLVIMEQREGPVHLGQPDILEYKELVDYVVKLAVQVLPASQEAEAGLVSVG